MFCPGLQNRKGATMTVYSYKQKYSDPWDDELTQAEFENKLELLGPWHVDLTLRGLTFTSDRLSPIRLRIVNPL